MTFKSHADLCRHLQQPRVLSCVGNKHYLKMVVPGDKTCTYMKVSNSIWHTFSCSVAEELGEVGVAGKLLGKIGEFRIERKKGRLFQIEVVNPNHRKRDNGTRFP